MPVIIIITAVMHTNAEHFYTFRAMAVADDFLFDGIVRHGTSFDIEHALVESGHSVDSENGDGCSILAFTLLHHQTEIAQTLIELGADISAVAKNGQTPLTELCFGDATYSNEIALLVSEGVDINAEDGSGTTPLMAAVMTNNLPNITALLNLGADPDRYTLSHPQPIMLAIDGKNYTVIRMLLGKGADINVSWADFETPLLKCLRLYPQHSDMDIYMPLLLGAEADTDIHEFGFSPFMYALVNRNIDWAHELLVRGCRICHQQPAEMPAQLVYVLDMVRDPLTTTHLNSLLFASGEQFHLDMFQFQQPHRIVVEMVLETSNMTLLNIARAKIRAHLVALGVNIFYQVHRLPITHVARNILLYQ